MWTRRNVRHEFLRESLDGISRGGFYSNSQNGLSEMFRTRIYFLVGTYTAAKCFDNRVSQRETCFAYTLQHLLADATRLGLGVATDDRQRSGSSKAIVECGADF